MITIIDYKSGNLKSISNGFKKIGAEYQISDDKEIIANSDYEDVIYEHVNDDKPFLGICLGQQVLMSSSDEAPGVEGLNLFKGHAELLSGDVKIPHMGWNQLNVCNDSPILEGIDKEYFYFVHSYHVVPDDENIIAGTCDYGGDVVASLSQNNLFSTQFHPEKSGISGLKILKNFTKLEI